MLVLYHTQVEFDGIGTLILTMLRSAFYAPSIYVYSSCLSMEIRENKAVGDAQALTVVS